MLYPDRLGKLSRLRVNDYQKIDVDDHKQNSGCPHDYSNSERSPYKIMLDFPIFPAYLYCSRKEIYMIATTNTCGRLVLEAYSSSDNQISR